MPILPALSIEIGYKDIKTKTVFVFQDVNINEEMVRLGYGVADSVT